MTGDLPKYTFGPPENDLSRQTTSQEDPSPEFVPRTRSGEDDLSRQSTNQEDPSPELVQRTISGGRAFSIEPTTGPKSPIYRRDSSSVPPNYDPSSEMPGTPKVYPSRSRVHRPLYPTKDYLVGLWHETDYRQTSLSEFALLYGVASITSSKSELTDFTLALDIDYSIVEQTTQNYPQDILLGTLEVLLQWSESVGFNTNDKFKIIQDKLKSCEKPHAFKSIVSNLVKLGIDPPNAFTFCDDVDVMKSLVTSLDLDEVVRHIPPDHRKLLFKLLHLPWSYSNIETLAAACGISSLGYSSLTTERAAFKIFLPWFANNGPLTLTDKYKRLTFGLARMGHHTQVLTYFSEAKKKYSDLKSVLPSKRDNLFEYTRFDGLCPLVDTTRRILAPWKYHFLTIVATYISQYDSLLAKSKEILQWPNEQVCHKHSNNKEVNCAHFVFKWWTRVNNRHTDLRNYMGNLQCLFKALNLDNIYMCLMSTYGQTIFTEAHLLFHRGKGERVVSNDPSGASEEEAPENSEEPLPTASHTIDLTRTVSE